MKEMPPQIFYRFLSLPSPSRSSTGRHLVLRMLGFVACSLVWIGLPTAKAQSLEPELVKWVAQFNADDTGLDGQILNDQALEFLAKNAPQF